MILRNTPCLCITDSFLWYCTLATETPTYGTLQKVTSFINLKIFHLDFAWSQNVDRKFDVWPHCLPPPWCVTRVPRFHEFLFVGQSYCMCPTPTTYITCPFLFVYHFSNTKAFNLGFSLSLCFFWNSNASLDFTYSTVLSFSGKASTYINCMPHIFMQC